MQLLSLSRRALFVFFILLVSLFAWTESAWAQGAAGISIKPATIEEPANPGEAKRYTVEISNLSDVDQLYYLSVRDISGVSDGNVPVFAEEGTERTGFELSEWVALDVTELSVLARATMPVSFTLTVPENASPGSHFGAVFVSVDPPRLRSTGASVGYQVANIISIRVAGEAVESVQIREFSTDRFLYGSTNVNFSLRIENEGNTLVRPVGPLEVTNMFGQSVAMLTFNENLGGVFPGATRDFEFSWSDESSGFGRYEARVSPIYGDAGAKKTMTSTVTFWILPMNIIGPALGILVFLLAVIYFSVRFFVRRTVAMAGVVGDRRIVRTTRRRSNPILLLTFLAMATTTVLFLIVLLILFA